MTMDKPAKGGGRSVSAKRHKGRGWLAKRARMGLTWHQRKMRSHRYIPATKTRG